MPLADHSPSPPNPQKDGLGYKPRCLRRDINAVAAAYTRADITHALITNSPDIKTFQNTLQGLDASNVHAFISVHAGGHFTIGGDPGRVRGLLLAPPPSPQFPFPSPLRCC